MARPSMAISKQARIRPPIILRMLWCIDLLIIS
jgi:hypothetical protein